MLFVIDTKEGGGSTLKYPPCQEAIVEIQVKAEWTCVYEQQRVQEIKKS